MTDADEKAERLAGRIEEKRDRHLQRSAPYRIIWVVAALIVIAAGLVMIVLPGPAVIVIPVGLAMLSLEFAWAARLTRLALKGGVEAEDAIQRAIPNRRLWWAAAALAVAAVAAVATILIL
ncbi:MAG: PGPGW domain-containing protein [Chloroflexota bacterium]|nr:PGPGW domain-containing protein [Chloroflexota bacterium]